jgi:cyclophilin family peptidyl-prolyl cis-trans isomerase
MAEQKRRQRWKSVRNFGLIVAAIVIVIVVLSLRNGDNKSPVAASSASSSAAPGSTFAYGVGPCPNADGSSPRTIDFTSSFQQCIDPQKTYVATFDTSAGSITVKLDTTTTPGTTNNFVALARFHYYDGTTIFRANKSIGILQGGSPHDQSSSDKGPGYALPDEGFDYNTLAATGQVSGGPYKYSPGDLVMARASKANGAGAQFFFAVDANTAKLNDQGVYVKFGTTTLGLDLLKVMLASAPADEQPPSPAVTINKVTVTET